MLDALFALGRSMEATRTEPRASDDAEDDRMLLALFRMAADGGHLGGSAATQAALLAASKPTPTPSAASTPGETLDPAIAAELYRVKLEGFGQAVESVRWGWAWRWKRRVTSYVLPAVAQAVDLLHAGLWPEVGPLFGDRAEEARQRNDTALAAVMTDLHRRHEDPAWNPLHPKAEVRATDDGALERLKFVGRMQGYALGIRSVCAHAPWRGWFLRTRPATAAILDQVAERVRDDNVGAAARLLEERRKSTPEVRGAFAHLVESPIYAAYAQSIAIGAGHD